MYTLSRHTTRLSAAGDLASTATTGNYSPCGREVIRKAKVLVTTATVGTSGIVTIKKRVTPGSDTGGTTIGTITVPVASAGAVYMLKDLNVIINPSDQVYAVVSTAMGTSGNGDISIEMEQCPDVPGNDPDVTIVTV